MVFTALLLATTSHVKFGFQVQALIKGLDRDYVVGLKVKAHTSNLLYCYCIFRSFIEGLRVW